MQNCLRTAFCFLLCVLFAPPGNAEPQHVYLTWSAEDLTRNITVVFQQIGKPKADSVVAYDVRPRNGALADYRTRAKATPNYVGSWDRTIYHANLQDLNPDKTYFFIAGDPKTGFSKEKKFQTLPSKEPLRFVTGGDMGAGKLVPEMLKHAAKESPMFAVVGGDIAYGNGKLSSLFIWDRWLTNWTQEMVRADGHLIPVILAIGNHDVRGENGGSKERAPFYFHFFPQTEGKSFFSRSVKGLFSLFVLDSGHIAPHDKEQVVWLAAALDQQKASRFKAAVYHVPLYPSVRSYSLAEAQMGRTHWAPLFDRFGLHVAFENHDHTLKRSKLLRGNRIVPKGGRLYLGDGSWGMWPRKPKKDRWYLEKSKSARHFWSVTLEKETATFEAINEKGDLLDRVRLSADHKILP